jgi:hypothetical protein
MISRRNFRPHVLVAASGPRLDTTASRFDRSVATAEHLFEGAQRSQQIGLM